MRFVTWNLNGLDDAHLDERTEAAVFVSILGARLDQLHAGTKAAPQPDVIAFQEVTARTFAAHLSKHLPAGGYKVIPPEAPERQTFEVLAVREAIALSGYRLERLTDSVYGRMLHVVELESVPKVGALRFATAHFDSGTDAGKVREAQFRQVVQAIGSRGLFCGDANFRKADWEAVKKDSPVVDAWEALGELSSTRFTWKREDYKARFDRVWLGSELRATSMGALGAEPLPGINAVISDHIGLAVEVEERSDG